MRPSHRTWQTFLRLTLIFIALCLALAHLEVATRQLNHQTIGLPNAILPRDPRPPASRLPFLGITIDAAATGAPDASAQAARFRELAAAGFGWVRVRVAWDHAQPAPRTFEWQHVDRTLAALDAADLIPVLLLDGTPAWARAPSDRQRAAGRFAPPANAAAFARFARSVAERYGDDVRYYQIWNEPNIAPHWGSRHIEPVDYARLLKAASTMIRAVDADAYILLASLAPTADRGHLALDESYFLNRLYAAGAAPYFDAVAMQPFGFANQPDDPEVDRNTLNFRRTLLIRQTMLDAGDGETPMWLLSFGWNRLPNSPWRSVLPEQQRAFTIDALRTAYRQWPWVVAMGWPSAAVSVPSTDPATLDNPAAGFALTPELLNTFHTASTELLTQRRPQQTSPPSLALWRPVALWWLGIVALLWRAVVAARRLPWTRWHADWMARPAWQQAGVWTLLILIYYFVTWPPLLLLCVVVATLGFLTQPRLGLALALCLLPFYDYHKEFDWLGSHWFVPPIQVVLFCLLPAIWKYRPQSLPRDHWLGVAVGWLLIMLLSATGVWHWPAYWIGMLNLVVTPLALFLLIRAWATSRDYARTFTAALAAGGVLIAGIGLLDWMQGTGPVVDGMRRLEGLGYSSNHTALYIIRTLAIAVGLLLATTGKMRWLWTGCALLTGAALLLTGSRGAILLGIPAGAFFLFSRQNLPLPSRRRMIGLFVVVSIGLVFMAWMWKDRLANFGTMIARMDGWIVALYLWFEHFLFGVGPDGFWWTFPAHMWLTSDADPNLRHPHNIWLELATSGGLLALVWLVGVGLLLYRWVRTKQNAILWTQVGLLTGLIAGFAHAQVDSFQSLSELAGWNWAALALLLAQDRTPE